MNTNEFVYLEFLYYSTLSQHSCVALQVHVNRRVCDSDSVIGLARQKEKRVAARRALIKLEPF